MLTLKEATFAKLFLSVITALYAKKLECKESPSLRYRPCMKRATSHQFSQRRFEIRLRYTNCVNNWAKVLSIIES